MSNPQKRLIIRLLLATVVAGSGTFAVLGTNGSLFSLGANDEKATEQGDGAAAESTDENKQSKFRSSLENSDPYGLSRLATRPPSTTPPEDHSAPPATVVRANDGGQFVYDSVDSLPGSVEENAQALPHAQQAPSAHVPSQGSGVPASVGSYVTTQAYGSMPPADPAGAISGATVRPAQFSGTLPVTPETGQAPSIPNATGSDMPSPPSASGQSGYLETPPTSPVPNSLPSQDTPQDFAQPTQMAPISNPAPAIPASTPMGNYATPNAASVNNTSPTPGAKDLEGVRAPSLALQKQAPPEVQVGKTATFVLTIRNVGQVAADEVVVRDRVPQFTRFEDATPQPERSPDGTLVWKLGTITPGNEATITMQLTPEQEGQIGSVATVTFETQASVSTRCTKPELVVEHSGPEQVLIGQGVVFNIKVTNNGTGVATGVTLEEDVPEFLSHSKGSEIEYEIGTLRPGESRGLQLTLQAAKAGRFENVLLIRGDGNLLERDAFPMEVIAPDLNIQLVGPKRRYLERTAKYSISVANPGTAPATRVELVAFLPKGMKFVSTNNQGQYDPQTHAAYWSLAQLPSSESGTVELSLLPMEIGDQKMRIESRADLGLTAETEQTIVVDGLAAVFFTVADTADPIEVGSETVYQVQVVNQGSKTATGVRVDAQLPPGMEPVSGEGPTTYQIQGQRISFNPLGRLAPKDQAIYKIQARGLQDGDQKITVQVVTNEIAPVAKEESTRVYADR